MKGQNDEMFAQQIGDFGDVQEEIQSDQPQTLGQLKHKPGKQQLSTDEKSELESFMNRSRESHDRGSMNDYSKGWIPINRAEMGIRSQFYPEDWEFRVRPATVEAIKNWSSIDEERIDVLNNVFNEIMKSCVSVVTPTGNLSWSKINSWDRFWFILKVREYTFAHGESKVEFTDNCAECDNELLFELKPSTLFYEFPDKDIVEKHWNSIERAWYIDPKDYGLEGKPAVKLYVPTLEKDDAILNWAIEKARANKKTDDVFLRFLPWMLAKAPKDEKVLEKFIGDCERIYRSWDADMFQFMDDVVRNITINPSEKLRQVCPHCGEEVVSNVRFPNGVKALFKTEAKHTKFGSR